MYFLTWKRQTIKAAIPLSIDKLWIVVLLPDVVSGTGERIELMGTMMAGSLQYYS